MKKLAYCIMISILVVGFFSGCSYKPKPQTSPQQKEKIELNNKPPGLEPPPSNKVKDVITNQEILKIMLEHFPEVHNNPVFWHGERNKYAFIIVDIEGKLKRLVFVKLEKGWTLGMVLDRNDYKNESLYSHITKKYKDFPQELIPSLDPMR